MYQTNFKLWPFPWGMPAPFWRKYLESIETFIKQHNLRPSGLNTPIEKAKVVGLREGAITIPIDPGSDGGDRGPHFHYKGDVYLLDEKQWKAFSESAVKNIQARLGRANTVALNDLIALDEVVAGMSIRPE